jgi:phage gpG-like protein
MADNRHANEFDELLKGYRAVKLRIIQQAAGMAVAHFKASFTNQGFTDQALVKWKPRKGGPNNKGRAIEVKSGAERRSIRIKNTSIDGAIVGIDEGLPYAEIQNFGGQIKITPQMRRFFWAMYYKFGGGQKTAKGKPKKISDTAQFYMNMALTKEQFITIPARQFIGDSRVLEQKIMNYVASELNKFFKIEP